MLKILIEKEIRDIIGSTKFVITFAVCAVLVLLSFYSGAANYTNARAQYEAAQRENLLRYEGTTDWESVDNMRALLPPEPLAALVAGVSNDIGGTIEVEARGELQAEGSKYAQEPVLASFRLLDLEFLFQVILSLFAIMLGYDAISGEKERGTLRLTFANAVSRATFIMGKLLGSLAALILPLLGAIALGCIILVLFQMPLSGQDWGRLVLIIFTGLLYCSVFLALAVMVSALTHRSSSSFLMLLVIWVAAVMIVPRASVLLAGRAVEVPTMDEIGSQKTAYSAQLWQEDRKKITGFTSTKTGDIQAIMDELNEFMSSIADERDRKMKEFAGRLNEERSNRLRQRQALALAFARLSPAASLSLAMSTLAGTSLGTENNFLSSASAYQQTFADFVEEKNGGIAGGRMVRVKISSGEEEPSATPVNLQEIPAFTYAPIPLSAAFTAAVVDMGLLVLLTMVFFAVAWIGFMRYDLR
ncbi:MAG: ABC transporter permease subunit [candidate division Zixibacteria bacterium]|nr:ABC transporter permease subunit [candidate division Zixibacteria bacterium]